MKKISVQIDDKAVEVTEIPIIKYAELLKALEVLPKKATELSGKSSDEIIQMLPLLIGDAVPDFVRIISVATVLKKEEIEVLGLAPIVRLTEAIIEVNDYEYLFNLAKKAWARYQTKTS